MKKLVLISLIGVVVSVSIMGCGAKSEPATYEVGKDVGESVASDDSDKASESTGAADESSAASDSAVAGNESSAPSESAGTAVDVKALADELLKQISYDDELSEVDLDIAKMFLNIADTDIAECSIYESSGATAEEIAVFKCADSDEAASIKTALEQRVSEQIDNFTDYVPAEVPKLKDAVIITSGEYAVLSVSGDSGKAKSIIEGALGK